MKIAYKDFYRVKIEKFIGSSYGSFDDTIEKENQWIAANAIEVFNVETLIEVASDHWGNHAKSSQSGIRVWYRQ